MESCDGNHGLKSIRKAERPRHTRTEVKVTSPIDQLDSREEANPLVMMLDGLHAEGRGNMCFACSGASDDHNIVGVINELAAMKLPHEYLVYLTAGEVKTVEIAIGWKACGLVEARRMIVPEPLHDHGLSHAAVTIDSDGGHPGAAR